MRVVGIALMATGVALSQPTAATVKVATVCEVLGNIDHYADSAVAIVGRIERSVSVADHYDFLSQDRCPRPLVTYGHTWSNKIEIWTDWEEGMSKPPSGTPTLETSVVAERLSEVRKTTPLGTHLEPEYAHGHWTSVATSNQWAVVYGQVVRSPRLDEHCGVRGCGGDDVPLILIATPANVHPVKAEQILARPQNNRGSTPAREQSLRRFLRAFDHEAQAADPDPNTRYVAAFADLNDDGKPEAIVHLIGKGWCGSGGCTTLILVQEGDAWKVLANIAITRPPILMLPSKSNGWRSVGVWVQGGGVQRGYEAELRFDGKTYPANPTVPPAQAFLEKTRSEVLISPSAVPKPLYSAR
jgi:hypothetical protein